MIPIAQAMASMFSMGGASGAAGGSSALGGASSTGGFVKMGQNQFGSNQATQAQQEQAAKAAAANAVRAGKEADADAARLLNKVHEYRARPMFSFIKGF